MKKLKYPLAIAVVLSLSAIAFVSCMHGGTIDSIVISPATATIARGTTQSFTASAHFSDGPSYTWTTAVEWSLSDTTDASIDTSGKVTTTNRTAMPSGTITAVKVFAKDAANNVVGEATLNIVDPFSISVTQASPAIPYLLVNGSTNYFSKQFSATGELNSAGTTTVTQDITSLVSWASSSLGTAIIDPITGFFSAGTTTGLVTIRAFGTYTNVSGNAVLLIESAPTTTLMIDPLIVSLNTGSTRQFSATGIFPDGFNTSALNPVWTWSSQNTTIATIDSTGLATGMASGTVEIYAKDPISALTSTATLTVN